MQGPRVQLVASTQFHGVDLGEGRTFEVTDTDDGGSAIAEAAGRGCYESWNRPNPRTATNADYLRHILEVGHGSVLEHGSATFYLTGLSRALTHELIRHRHLSYSQKSQRFVNEADGQFVMPPCSIRRSTTRTSRRGRTCSKSSPTRRRSFSSRTATSPTCSTNTSRRRSRIRR
ncbi:FAD-dependent thymidylate synthase [Rhodococcus hoagii]|nr:FAD-dependent thymidylate synthase [Prescottella equi]